MNFQDLIVKGGEITKAEIFKPEDKVCLLMLVPKSESAASVAVLNVKLSGNKERIDYPFVVGAWNPVLINEANIVQQNLTDYRIFWGVSR